MCLLAQSLSCVWSFVTPWTIAHQAPLSIDFPAKNTGTGCHFLLQGIFLTQEIKPTSPALQADSFITKPLGKPRVITGVLKSRSRGRRRLDVRVMKCEKDSTDYWWLWSWKQATSQGMQAISWNWKGREMDFLRASKKEHSPVETLAQGKPHQTYNLQNYKIIKVYCFKSLSLW